MMFVAIFVLYLSLQTLGLSIETDEPKTLIYHLDEENDLYYVCQFGTQEEVTLQSGSFEKKCFEQNEHMRQIINGVTYYPYLKFGSELGYKLRCKKDIPGGNLSNCVQEQQIYSTCNYSCKEGYTRATNGSITCDLVGPTSNVSAKWTVENPCILIVQDPTPTGQDVMSTAGATVNKPIDNQALNPSTSVLHTDENDDKLVITIVCVVVGGAVLLVVLFGVMKYRRWKKAKTAKPDVLIVEESSISGGSTSQPEDMAGPSACRPSPTGGNDESSENTFPKVVAESSSPSESEETTVLSPESLPLLNERRNGEDTLASSGSSSRSNRFDDGLGRVEPTYEGDYVRADGRTTPNFPVSQIHQVEDLKAQQSRNGPTRGSNPHNVSTGHECITVDSGAGSLTTDLGPSNMANDQAISELYQRDGHLPSISHGRIGFCQRGGNIHMNMDREIKGSIGSKMNGVLKEMEPPLQTGSSDGNPKSPKLFSNGEVKQESMNYIGDARIPLRVNAAPVGAAGDRESSSTNQGSHFECTESVGLFRKQSMTYMKELVCSMERTEYREKYQALEGFMREHWKEFGFVSKDEVEVIVNKHNKPDEFVSEKFLRRLSERDVKIGRLVEYFCNIHHFNRSAVDIMLKVHNCQYCQHIRDSVPKL